jgi:hypothetical protein
MPYCGFLVVVVLSLVTSAVSAAGRVQLEVAGDPQAGAVMGFQQWLQALSRAGVQNVRMRAAEGNVKVGVEVRGTQQDPIYVVTGVINAKDELVVPGGRFTRGQTAKLKAWLDDLAKHGTPDRRESKAAFGLTDKQFEKVRADLAGAITFNTKNMTRSEAAGKIVGQLTNSLRVPRQMENGEEKIEEELQGLSCGTALACILRPAGYAMAPRESGARIDYVVSKVTAENTDREIWPIGWKPEKRADEVLPGLFEVRNVNVANVSAATLLAAVSKHIKVPVLLDHNALARHGIDPEKAMVAHPSKRTTYSSALRRILGQAGMKYELRVDEAGKPLLWVTSVKPV